MMFNDQLPDPNVFLASRPLKSILTGEPSPPGSQSYSQINSLRNSTPSSPPIIDHDFSLTIDFEQIDMLSKIWENLRVS